MPADERGILPVRASRGLGARRDLCGTWRTGFTLLEILLALALIGLLSAALVSAAVNLVDSQPKSPEEIFWAANKAARKKALNSEQNVLLSYDSKDKRFVVGQGDAVQTFAIPNPKDLTVDLLRGQATAGNGGSVLLGGQLVETGSLPNVTYYSDGTCTPFRVQFRTNGPAHILAIDPWTCAPMLPRPANP